MKTTPQKKPKRGFNNSAENKDYLDSIRERFPEFDTQTDTQLIEALDKNTQRERLRPDTIDHYKEGYGHRLDQREIADKFFAKKEIVTGDNNIILSNGYQYGTNKLEGYIYHQNIGKDIFDVGKHIDLAKKRFALDNDFTGIELCDTVYDSLEKQHDGYSIWIHKDVYANALRRESVPESSIIESIEEKTNPSLATRRGRILRGQSRIEQGPKLPILPNDRDFTPRAIT